MSVDRTRRSILKVGAVGSLSLLAGCGGSGGNGTPTATASPTESEPAGTPTATPTPTETPTPQPEASLRFADQQTNGSTVVLAEVSVDVPASVTILNQQDQPIASFDTRAKFDGTTGQNITVELDTPLVRSTELQAVIRGPKDTVLATDQAAISIPGLNQPIDVTLVDADPAAGFNYPYYLRAPPAKLAVGRPLLLQSNNTPEGPSDDFSIHRQAAKNHISEGFPRLISHNLILPTIVPVIPRPKTDPVGAKTIVQDLDTDTMHITSGKLARIDRQVLKMIEDARSRLRKQNYPVNDRLFVNGFSSSGFFANRFTALHPDTVDAVAAGGIGGHPILPRSEAKGYTLNYPIGVADFEALIGHAFEQDAWVDVAQYLYMGAEDQADPFDHNDHWEGEQKEKARDVYGEDMIDDRFTYAESVYNDAGADATFKVFSGVGHDTPPKVGDAVTEFFREQLQSSKLQ